MMTKRQQVLYQLLKEIHKICEENEITYVLHPQLVLFLQNGLDIPENQKSRCVYMTSDNMHRFVSVCSRNLPKNRSIESLHSNPMYPYLYSARYGDTKTFHLNVNEGSNYINNVMFIQIEVLRSCPQSKIKKKILTILESGWRANTYQYGIRFRKKDFLSKAIVRCMLLIGRKNLSYWLYKLTSKVYQYENSLVLIRWKNQNLSFSRQTFEAEQFILFDGSLFYVPAGWREFLQIVFGEDYMRILEERYICPMSIIENPYMSGDSFFEKYPNLSVFFQNRIKFWKEKNKIETFYDYMNFCWTMVNMAADKYKLKSHYEKNRLRILDLKNDQKWSQLMTMFDAYYNTQKKYAKAKQTFTIDPELDQIYYETLCYNGKTDFAKKMKRYL